MSSWTTTMSWAAVALVPLVAGLTTPQLRDRSIYQVITDRFARADGRVDVYCDPNERTYCGGGWKGIEHQLGYIQGMGFDTGEVSWSDRAQFSCAVLRGKDTLLRPLLAADTAQCGSAP